MNAVATHRSVVSLFRRVSREAALEEWTRRVLPTRWGQDGSGELILPDRAPVYSFPAAQQRW